MDIDRFERALIGFLIGGLMGYGINFLFVWIWNQIAIRIGQEPIPVTWSSGVVLALLLGLSMAINMARPPFGD
jgi:hypothetical protein